jgi:hypothetical protein
MHVAERQHRTRRIRVWLVHIEVPRVRTGQSGAPAPILIEAPVHTKGSHPVKACVLQRRTSLKQVPAEAEKNCCGLVRFHLAVRERKQESRQIARSTGSPSNLALPRSTRSRGEMSPQFPNSRFRRQRPRFSCRLEFKAGYCNSVPFDSASPQTAGGSGRCGLRGHIS